MTDASEITELLVACGEGEREAFDRLFPAVYDELRGIAHRHMRRERGDHTLGTTALVHECYLNLVDQTRSTWKDRAHFFAVASRAMRHILIDYARRKKAEKRGGERQRVTLDERMISVEQQAADLLAVDQALTQLAERNSRMAKVVECRFFGGMTVEETSVAVGVSLRTVERDWTRAKAHLQRALDDQNNNTDSER